MVNWNKKFIFAFQNRANINNISNTNLKSKSLSGNVPSCQLAPINFEFNTSEFHIPFEVGNKYLKKGWFARYMFWAAVSKQRGGYMKTGFIKQICAQFNLDYEKERKALYKAVGDGLVDGDKHGLYKFKNIAAVGEMCGLRISKDRHRKLKIQTQAMVIFQKKELAGMTVRRFRAAVIATATKVFSTAGAKHAQMVSRFRLQLKEKGYWDNYKVINGEKVLHYGTAQELREIAYWFKTNSGIKIPVPDSLIEESGLKPHFLTNSKTKISVKSAHNDSERGIPFQEGTLKGTISNSGSITESGVTPAQHIDLVQCAARFTCYNSHDHEIAERGYYTTIHSQSPLVPELVKSARSRVHIGKVRKRPWTARSSKIERRYRKFHFSIYDDRTTTAKPKPAVKCNYKYNVFERCASYRNIASAVGCSPTTVLNYAKHGFCNTVSVHNTITVLGNWNTELAKCFNTELRKAPMALQSMVVPISVEKLNKAMSNGTVMTQLGLTGFIDLKNLSETAMVLKSKTLFVFLEQRGITISDLKKDFKGSNSKEKRNKSLNKGLNEEIPVKSCFSGDVSVGEDVLEGKNISLKGHLFKV